MEDFLNELDCVLYTLALAHMEEAKAAEVVERIRAMLKTIEFPEE